MLTVLTAAFLLSTAEPPIDHALDRTEPPGSVRAAFTVQLTDGEAFREVRFDPRLPKDEGRWVVEAAEGKSDDLDRAVDVWSDQTSPDGWLFADDLRQSMGRVVEVEDLGAAWKVHFEHLPSSNDGPLDIWAMQHLAGEAWLDPVTETFVRIDYTSKGPFDGPDGGRVEHYEHNYALQQDPVYGLTFIAAYKVDVQGSFLGRKFERSYRARVTSMDVFFGSPAEEALFVSKQRQALRPLVTSFTQEARYR